MVRVAERLVSRHWPTEMRRFFVDRPTKNESGLRAGICVHIVINIKWKIAVLLCIYTDHTGRGIYMPGTWWNQMICEYCQITAVHCYYCCNYIYIYEILCDKGIRDWIFRWDVFVPSHTWLTIYWLALLSYFDFARAQCAVVSKTCARVCDCFQQLTRWYIIKWQTSCSKSVNNYQYVTAWHT